MRLKTCNPVRQVAFHTRHGLGANKAEPAYDTTFLEPPETPAHQFAVKAFKHAIFGTPTGREIANPNKIENKTKLDVTDTKALGTSAPKENAAISSPSKRPGGILATPGTANKGRKTVSFGSQVVDNEGKRANAGKSGIPNDCPGKFPSPWTPGTELKVNAGIHGKPHNKLTAALLNAQNPPQSHTMQRPKARDDSDVTIDVTAPRSESGKYWKEQYERYADKSEKEMKKLIAKQQLAKNFAKKKDGEMTELTTKLAEERKRFRQREQELEQQKNDYQEYFRQVAAENKAANIEIATLKSQILFLEKSFTVSSSEAQADKNEFQIFEDPNKDSTYAPLEQYKTSKSRTRDTTEPRSIMLEKPVQSSHIPLENKENSPPKSQRIQRQTLSDVLPQASTSHSAISETVAQPLEAPEPLSIGQTAPNRLPQPFARSTLTARTPEPPSNFPMALSKSDLTKENLLPKSPAALASSPLPQPSPDTWAGLNDSSLQQIDRLAFPISTGISHSRPIRTSHLRSTHHRTSKSVSRIKPDISIIAKDQSEKLSRTVPKLDSSRSRDSDPPVSTMISSFPSKATTTSIQDLVVQSPKPEAMKTENDRARHVPSMAKDKERLPMDRKEMARRRLAERKLKRVES